ncbi:hypothetical protein HYH03_014040 [Edaphochlamys debaryana]|uniref:Uncharacterized protein n=1 Tax=Edaphochlamys debaryana TaxID=47281 RepID=A0A835XNI6_9CHLO|nr:hypothetical protein HYH03_014040 [Edaphochlamys debaryana]|eukprot:KAG2487323.1 hypothetical protein HYH03_014040 [Edaphochlamys debaryana]
MPVVISLGTQGVPFQVSRSRLAPSKPAQGQSPPQPVVPPANINRSAVRWQPNELSEASGSTDTLDVVFDAAFLENAGGFDLTGRAGELIAQGKALIERLADVQARKAQLAKQELSLSLDISDARRALLEELQLQRQRRREGPPSPPSPQHPAAGAFEAAAPPPTQAEVRVKQEPEAGSRGEGAPLGPSGAALRPPVLRSNSFSAAAAGPPPPHSRPPPDSCQPKVQQQRGSPRPAPATEPRSFPSSASSGLAVLSLPELLQLERKLTKQLAAVRWDEQHQQRGCAKLDERQLKLGEALQRLQREVQLRAQRRHDGGGGEFDDRARMAVRATPSAAAAQTGGKVEGVWAVGLPPSPGSQARAHVRHLTGGGSPKASPSPPASPSQSAHGREGAQEASGRQPAGARGLEELAKAAAVLDGMASMLGPDAAYVARRRSEGLERAASLERPVKRHRA